jgi:hypothetical protein
MPIEFSGPAKPLMDADIVAAAANIGCKVAAIRAVIDVESRGGFLPDGRPKILFERHYFSRLTQQKFDASNPEISNPVRGGYKGGTAEYDRLAQAIKLHRNAALQSASWGSFQIMGSNYKAAGHSSVENFVAAMVAGSSGHLNAFVNFVKNEGLADDLIRRDWAGFARGYNGAAYKENAYDTKLANAYRKHSQGASPSNEARTAAFPILQQGDSGDAVKRLQKALGLGQNPNGNFGPNTHNAVMALQKKHGLLPDGIVGQRTWALLKL